MLIVATVIATFLLFACLVPTVEWLSCGSGYYRVTSISRVDIDARGVVSVQLDGGGQPVTMPNANADQVAHTLQGFQWLELRHDEAARLPLTYVKGDAVVAVTETASRNFRIDGKGGTLLGYAADQRTINLVINLLQTLQKKS